MLTAWLVLKLQFYCKIMQNEGEKMYFFVKDSNENKGYFLFTKKGSAGTSIITGGRG